MTTQLHILRYALVGMALAGAADALACTSLIAAKGATDDGSTMITYAADSHTLYGELYHQPAADHEPGAMRAVYDWDTGVYRGEIPEVAHTYATIGNMNEHGLTIAESTWGGRPELEGSGLVDYGSLIYITLQRARTAREAIDVMTGLVRDYGYASEGESFSIADPEEVWIMELIGKGKADKGAVWVARRVPDGHISGHANHARIHRFPRNEATTLYSPDVVDFARKQGYYKGKDKDFDFSRAYAITDVGATRGCDGRVWGYFRRFGQSRALRGHAPRHDHRHRRRPLRCALSLASDDVRGGFGHLHPRARHRHAADGLLVRVVDERRPSRGHARHTVVRRRRCQHLRLHPRVQLHARASARTGAWQRRHAHAVVGRDVLGEQLRCQPGI